MQSALFWLCLAKKTTWLGFGKDPCLGSNRFTQVNIRTKVKIAQNSNLVSHGTRTPVSRVVWPFHHLTLLRMRTFSLFLMHHRTFFSLWRWSLKWHAKRKKMRCDNARNDIVLHKPFDETRLYRKHYRTRYKILKQVRYILLTQSKSTVLWTYRVQCENYNQKQI